MKAKVNKAKFVKPSLGYKIMDSIVGNTESLIKHSRVFKTLRFFLRFTPKEQLIQEIIDYADMYETKGDYLEFGVYKGDGLITAYNFSKRYKTFKDMKFYAFDSFEGLPKPKGIDKEHKYFYEGDYNCSVEDFKKRLKRHRIDLDKIEIVKGWYENSLKKKFPNLKVASVVYIDCDLYESTKLALDFITDYIVEGTIIVLNDWFYFRNNPNKGEQKAFNEWVKENEINVSQFITPNSFVVA